jgi:hypothetical protein
MDRARDGVDSDGDQLPMLDSKRHAPIGGRFGAAFLLVVVASLSWAVLASAQTRRAAPKPSPTPDPMVGQMENVVAELREINVTLGAVKTALNELGGRLDRLEQAATETKGIATPMREEVRGLYVETSNVRSEIARLEEKSIAEAESLGKSRYVLTLLLVATAVLQLVVLAVLLRSR